MSWLNRSDKSLLLSLIIYLKLTNPLVTPVLYSDSEAGYRSARPSASNNFTGAAIVYGDGSNIFVVVVVTVAVVVVVVEVVLVVVVAVVVVKVVVASSMNDEVNVDVVNVVDDNGVVVSD